jgi:hypothetical protein
MLGYLLQVIGKPGTPNAKIKIGKTSQSILPINCIDDIQSELYHQYWNPDGAVFKMLRYLIPHYGLHWFSYFFLPSVLLSITGILNWLYFKGMDELTPYEK